jgi:hypothetical protein
MKEHIKWHWTIKRLTEDMIISPEDNLLKEEALKSNQ